MIRTLPWDELLLDAAVIDAAAARTQGIDRFCSSSAWVVPAATSLTPPRSALVLDSGDALFVGALTDLSDGTPVVCPLEMAWGLSCPVLSANPRQAAEVTRAALAEAGGWKIAIMTGIDLQSAHGAAVANGLATFGQVRVGAETTVRWVASLAGGVDGYLSRRSKNLRRSLARASRRAAAAGIVFDVCDASTAEQARSAYRRGLAVEASTWKHEDGVGFLGTPMESFYADMVERLALRGGHRQIIARRGTRDLGYVLGGVFANTYRGLQFGYASEARAFSLGGLMQLETIKQLAKEGIARYDLGTDLDYKRRWAEDTFETRTLIVVQDERD